LAAVSGVYGQQQEINALQDSLDEATSDNQKVDILNALAERSLEYDLNLSLESAAAAKELSGKLDYKQGTANANKWLGEGNVAKGNSPEAVHYFMDALIVFQELNDSLKMADVYKNLANIYSDNGNDSEAMRYYNTAMMIYGKMENHKGQSSILNNIGTIYLKLNDGDSALFYLDQARLSNLEVRNEDGLASNYTNMGFAYALKNDFERAIEYYNKSYALALKIGNKETTSTALLNIGDGYLNLNQYSRAEKYVKDGLKIAEAVGYKYNLFIGYYTLGEINEKRGNYREGLEWYHKSENIFSDLRGSATIKALMDVQTMQLEEAQKREIETINSINDEKIQTAQAKNLLFLSLAASALLMLLGLTYYFMKRHKASLKIDLQNKEISHQKEKIEKQSDNIRHVNDVLSIRNNKLREINEEKNYLMSVVAHDLKSPLNQINGLANVIKLDQNNLNKSQQECLENITVSSGRLSGMVDKILDSGRAEKGKVNIIIEDIDLEKMTDEVINDFNPIASNKKIVLSKKSTNKEILVRADKHYLRQIFDNLVSNAIKFSPKGKSIDLSITPDGDMIVTEIKDEGPGLTEEDMEKLFTEYAVLSAKPTDGEKSTGLGLAIVKDYVEKMGGEIWCESKQGQGASFKFKLDRV